MAEELVDDKALHASAVVANCAMNRERQLAGVNSYARELGFNPLDWLVRRLQDQPPAADPIGWLDLCCGTGRALGQAAAQVARLGLGERARLVGVDLVDAFDNVPAPADCLEFVVAPVTEWTPDRRFDLITCVHGLHYVGDKLAVLARAASWLTNTGLLVADLDLASIRVEDDRSAGRPLRTQLRAAGYRYDARRHRISRTGRADVRLPYRYLGADRHAGPNYTGQPAVDSHYRSGDGPCSSIKDFGAVDGR